MKLPSIFNALRRKQLPQLSSLDYNRGWINVINEPYAGAWQRSDHIHRTDSLLANSTVFRCITLIASDIAKMRLKLVEEDSNGIWQEIDSAAFSPVLRKPNEYQNRIQFFEHWLISKLSTGNTYVLKARDGRGVVTDLYILDPQRVKPLVAPDGAIYYQLRRDDLSGLGGDDTTLPAREIIHDRMNALYHPLCGLSPIYAAGLAATQALRIQKYSDRFFANNSRPSGILTAPGLINKETAERIKVEWQQGFSGENIAKIAALGDGMKYDPMGQNAVDSQLIEQLKWSAENICSVFGVPAYKVINSLPSYNNIEAISQEYYSQTLQTHIESIELLLDEGLDLPTDYGVEFDLEGLLRMDTATMVESIAKAVGAGVMAPNEGRKKLGLSPTPGGNTPYLQVQNYSLAALNKRDIQADPFSVGKPPVASQQPATELPPPQGAKALPVVLSSDDLDFFQKELSVELELYAPA